MSEEPERLPAAGEEWYQRSRPARVVRIVEVEPDQVRYEVVRSDNWSNERPGHGVETAPMRSRWEVGVYFAGFLETFAPPGKPGSED